MVDFSQKLTRTSIEKKTNPIEIYESLDRRAETGPLRPTQEFILKEWYNSRKEDRDLILKLHTGEGKTLIGLLILLSNINSENSPCLYLCPNKYLSKQVMNEAEKFGIPYCEISTENTLPNDFIDGNKILITHIQKLFNGKTIFGLDHQSQKISSIILDDSHACIDSIKNSFTLTFKRDHEIYNSLFDMFSEDIREQGEGSFFEIDEGNSFTMLPIPYWAWYDKKSEIVREINKYKSTDNVKFVWPFIKNNICNYQAYISGNEIEISPYLIPIERFGSFSNASNRILMSATTQDDSFFIKGLGFNIESIKNPLNNSATKWSGERMIIIPSLIHDDLDRDHIVSTFAKVRKDIKFGIVFLVNSFNNAVQHESLGSIIATTDDIYEKIASLKNSQYESPIVLVNRYDGIDLPDNSCRILIVDSKPYFNSLCDKYEESCRTENDLINIKIAQKIEQGIGRSVRGAKDYSVVIVTGNDLVGFIKSSKTNKYFSSQTRKQVDIGLEIADLAKGDLDQNKPAKVLIDLINKSLQRDDGWKAFYNEKMEEITDQSRTEDIYSTLYNEYIAEKYNYDEQSIKAIQNTQQIIDNTKTLSEKGWYLQTLARYQYPISPLDSSKAQLSAYDKNKSLLKPKVGIVYKKMQFINENRVKRIRKWIQNYTDSNDLIINVSSILSNLTFGTESEKFESAMKEIGLLLGFLSERPDKEYKKGPDNLWCGVNNHYFLIECKSEVLSDRVEISKTEAGQINNHCGWFKKEYGDSPVTNIVVIPTRNLSYNANFTNDVKIMRKGKLRELRKNILGFIKEFNKYVLDDISNETIQSALEIHKLTINNLITDYVETYYQKTR